MDMIRYGRGVRRAAEADWTALPDLALDHIVAKLHSFKTCLSFSLVCKSWGTSVFRSCPPEFLSQLNKLVCNPMLLIGDNNVFSVFTGQVSPLYPVVFSPYPSSCISRPHEENGTQVVTLGSSFRWLFIYNSEDHCKFKIIDSLCRKQVSVCYSMIDSDNPLSPVNTLSPGRMNPALSRLCKVDHRGVVSDDDVLAIWFTLSTTDHLLLLDAFYNRLFVKLQIRGRLQGISGRILDIASIGSTVFCLHTTEADLYVSQVSKLLRQRCGRLVLYDDRSMKEKLPTPALSRCCSVYLVGSYYSASRPWLVIRHKTINRDGNLSTVGFQVFEGVHIIRRHRDTEYSFVRVSKLHNNVLFIGQKSAIRRSGLLADFGLLEPNTVYYLDDGDRENVNTVSDLDMGVFDMENGCRRPFPIPEHTKELLSDELMKHHSPPLWFLN